MTSLQEKILSSLHQNGPQEFWQLAKNTGYVPDVVKEVERLEKKGHVTVAQTIISLTKKAPTPKQGRPLSQVMKEFLRYRNEKDFSKDEFDQLTILPRGIEAKLRLMLENNDLANKHVLCLGDDDFFGIASALTDLPKSVTVIDLDPEILAFIERTPLKIKTAKVDLIKGVPTKMKKQFDVIITEPPDTLQGMVLFLNRAVQMLNPKGGVLYAGMTESTVSRKTWFSFEQAVLTSGLVLTDVLRDFEPYVTIGDELKWEGFESLPKWINKPPQKPWFVSALFRAESSGSLKPVPVKKKSQKEMIRYL